MEYAQRQNDLGHGVAFVIMDSAVHDDDLLALDLAEDQGAVVTRYSRYGKAVDLAVGDLLDDLDVVRVVAESAAQYQCDIGNKIGFCLDLRYTILQCFVVFLCIKSLIGSSVDSRLIRCSGGRFGLLNQLVSRRSAQKGTEGSKPVQ